MAGSLKKVKCPLCGKKTLWDDNPYRPFCSKECKLADLYNWLSEVYKISLPEKGGEVQRLYGESES